MCVVLCSHAPLYNLLTCFQVPLESCDYLIDLDYPLHPVESILEPRYVSQNATWERTLCRPFLDARYSSLLTRVLWLPGELWQAENEFGDYCLLKNKALVQAKQDKVKLLLIEGSIKP